MFDQLKKLLDKLGGRWIIVDDNGPKYVVLAFEEFEKLMSSNASPAVFQDKERFAEEQQPAKVATAQTIYSAEEINAKIKELTEAERKSKEISIDELPF